MLLDSCSSHCALPWLPKGRPRNDKGGWGRAVACLHPKIYLVGLELVSLTAVMRKPRWSSTVLSALALSVATTQGGWREEHGERQEAGWRCMTQPCQQLAVLLPTGRTTASLETAQDSSHMDKSSC